MTNQIAASLIRCYVVDFIFSAGDAMGEGDAHFNISMAYEQVGDVANALKHMEQAYTVHAKVLGAGHAYVLEAKQEVQRLSAQQ